MIIISHQRSNEQFWKQHKITTVTRNNIDEKFRLFKKGFQISKRAHLPLYESEPDDAFFDIDKLRALFVIDIVPFQQYSILLRTDIAFKIVFHDFQYVEIIT